MKHLGAFISTLATAAIIAAGFFFIEPFQPYSRADRSPASASSSDATCTTLVQNCNQAGWTKLNGACFCSANLNVAITDEASITECALLSAGAIPSATNPPVQGQSCAYTPPGGSFNSTTNCPKILMGQIWKDRRSDVPFVKGPKEACMIVDMKTLSSAEALEEMLAANPVTTMGLPPHSITNPGCFPKNYSPSYADLGRTIKEIGWDLHPVATEQERMTTVAEYYYHMNKIKYAEQGLISQIAGINALLGEPLAPKDCADPYNRLSVQWCQSLEQKGCLAKTSSSLDSIAKNLKPKYEKINPLLKQLKANEDSKNGKEIETRIQDQELQSQIDGIVGEDSILKTKTFSDAAEKSHGDLRVSIKAQLDEVKSNLIRKLGKFKAASKCLNSATSMNCPELEVVNDVPDTFLPEMVTGTKNLDKEVAAETYMDRIACYQHYRGKKEKRLQWELGAEDVVAVLATGGWSLAESGFSVGEAVGKVAPRVAKYIPSLFANAQLASFMLTEGLVAPELKRTMGQCIDDQHKVEGFRPSSKIDFGQLSCASDSKSLQSFVRHSYANCLVGLSGAVLAQFGPTRYGLKTGAVLGAGATTVLKGVPDVAKSLIVLGPVLGFVNNFITLDMNILNQQAAQEGAQFWGSSAKILTNWLSEPKGSMEHHAKVRALTMLANDLDDTSFQGLNQGETDELLQSSLKRAYQVQLNSQTMLRGDQRDSVAAKQAQLNSYVSPVINYLVADNNRMLKEARMREIQKNILDQHKPANSGQLKEMDQLRAGIDLDQKTIANVVAYQLIGQLMNPQYRTDDLFKDPNFKQSFDLLMQMKKMGYLTDYTRNYIQGFLMTQGWTLDQGKKVIDASTINSLATK